MKEGQVLAKKVFTQNQLSSPGGTVILFLSLTTQSLSNEGHPYKQGPSPVKITADDRRSEERNAVRPHAHTHCASSLYPSRTLHQKTTQSCVLLADPSPPWLSWLWHSPRTQFCGTQTLTLAFSDIFSRWDPAHVLLLCANSWHAISVGTICDDDQFYYLIEVMSIRFLNCKLLFPSEIKKKTVANTVRLCNYPSPCRIFESLTFKNCGFMNSQWIVPQTIILMLNLSQNRLVVGFFQAGSCVLPICLHHSLRTFLLFHIKCSRRISYFFPSHPGITHFTKKPWFLSDI